MLEIRKFELPPIGTHAYLVLDTNKNEAVLFDAPLNAYPTIERVLVKEGISLKGVYLTHGHWDHILDGHRFNGMESPCPVWAHRGDELFYANPQSMSSFALPELEMKPVAISQWLEDKTEYFILGRPVEVRHVPGHSQGSVLYWFKEDGFAISGDAIFRNSIGRTDFPGCSFEVLEKSIQESIYTLPDETQLLPGHGPETSVGFEKAHNPFVRP